MTNPTMHIRAVAMDAFKTAILEKHHFASPYKTLITTVFPRQQRGEAITMLRKSILTQDVPLDYVMAEASSLDLYADNAVDVGFALRNAHDLLDNQLHKSSFVRNPEVDDVMFIADRNNMCVGIISDLASPYGEIVERNLRDVNPRFCLLSYTTGCVKQDQEPFIIMSERMGVDLEELVYVGNDFKSDYLTPKEMGMQAFWYVPNKKELTEHDVNAEKLLNTYADDVVTKLPQIFEKLEARGYTIGG